MARAKPTPTRLCELLPGQSGDFYAKLVERTKAITREGKPYFTCRFRDTLRSVRVMIWVDGGWFEVCEKEWKEGVVYRIRAQYDESERFGPQLDLLQLRPANDADRAEGYNPDDFLEKSRQDLGQMLASLQELVQTQLKNEPLRRLVLGLVTKHGPAWQRAPGSAGKYYPFVGGLLEHTLSVAQICLLLVDRYASYYTELTPPLNRDLVLAAAILHDLGRVVELQEDGQPTVPGRLLGHLFLGRDLVRAQAQEQGDVPAELLQLLEHLLVSHLNLPEWGSPRLPLIPESLILHHVDDLDAKLEMYVRCLSRDQSAGPFTDRDPVLNRQLFKGRSV